MWIMSERRLWYALLPAHFSLGSSAANSLSAGSQSQEPGSAVGAGSASGTSIGAGASALYLVRTSAGPSTWAALKTLWITGNQSSSTTSPLTGSVSDFSIQ